MQINHQRRVLGHPGFCSCCLLLIDSQRHNSPAAQLDSKQIDFIKRTIKAMLYAQRVSKQLQI